MYYNIFISLLLLKIEGILCRFLLLIFDYMQACRIIFLKLTITTIYQAITPVKILKHINRKL